MRVLHLTRDFPPRVNGGISVAVGGLVRALSQTGVECKVVSFDAWRPKAHPTGKAEVLEGIGDQVVRVSSVEQLDAVRRSALEFEPQVIHVHHEMLWDFAETIREKVQVEIPALVTVHVLQSQQNRIRGMSERTLSLEAQELAFRRADLVVAPSRTVANLLCKDYPDVANRIALAGLGVDDDLTAQKEGEIGKQIRGPRGPVLYAGRFGDIKGTADLFEAIGRVVAEVPDTDFVIAGGLPENRKADARWRRRFASQATEQAFRRVSFTGWLSGEALAAEYCRASIFIAPSLFETFGQTVCEAMLHGVPVVASSCGAFRELIQHGRNGLLFEAGDSAGLAASTIALLEDPKLALRLGNAGAESIRSERLRSQVIARHEEIYVKVTRGRIDS